MQYTIFYRIDLERTSSVMNEDDGRCSAYLIGVVPYEFGARFHMAGCEEGYPGKSNVPRVDKDILNENIGRTRMIVKSRDVAFKMRIHHKDTGIVVRLRMIDKGSRLLHLNEIFLSRRERV